MGSLKSAAPLFVLIGLMIAFSAYVKSWALIHVAGVISHAPSHDIVAISCLAFTAFQNS
ncbi:hypothetical protein [Klebsiella michiganensis]|uniref:hypothetical protein n=1 Tax=Klebsiella michiganensis TaxID=1134687 RepID=UPI001D0E6E78|nr:hypothetical protein [Klebsiella michiganensis]